MQEQLLTLEYFPKNFPQLHDNNVELPLTGNSVNALIEAVTPLFGVLLHLQEVKTFKCPTEFCKKIINDIKALNHTFLHSYSAKTIEDCQYILCTFFDEVLVKINVNQFFLSRLFHEVWGGDKIFTLLDEALSHSEEQKDLLNFISLCFCFGLQGRYILASANQNEFNSIINKLQNSLININEKNTANAIAFNLTFESPKKMTSKYKFFHYFTVKKILISGILLLTAIYGFYSFQLNKIDQDIVKKIHLLQK